MLEAPRLIFTGNVIVDIVMTIDALPESGGDVLASASLVTAGGGYNAMLAAVRDGLKVVFAGQYGSGVFGSIVRDALAAHAVEVVLPGLADVDSGYCVVLVDAAAERTFVTAVGAEGRLTLADLDRVRVREQDLVYVTGYGLAHPLNAKALASWLPTLPAPTRMVFDPSPLVGSLEPELLSAVLARCDVVSVNAREGRIMTGYESSSDAVRALARRVRGGGAAIVRVGPAGAWLYRAGDREPELVPSVEVDAVDSNGAGDAHAGVLAAALARGDSIRAATRRANVAAALAVTRRGPATSPERVEIDTALAAGQAP